MSTFEVLYWKTSNPSISWDNPIEKVVLGPDFLPSTRGKKNT